MFGITVSGRLNRKQYWARLLILISLFVAMILIIFVPSAKNIQTTPESIEKMSYHIQYLIAKDILSIKQSSSSDNKELSQPILLEKSLKIIDQAYADYFKKQTEVQQMQPIKKGEYQHTIEEMIKNPTSFTCPKEFEFLWPISKMIANANTLSIQELKDIQTQTIIESSIGPTSGIILLIGYLYVVIYKLSIAIRRGHDLGMSGWVTFLTLCIPIIGIFYLIFLLFWAGQFGTNKYG